MKQQITYGDLRAIDADIQRMQNSPALSLFLRKYIMAFYNKNRSRLEVLQKTITEVITKYVKHINSIPTTKKNEDGVEVYVFNDEEAESEYKLAMQTFLNLSFDIEI